MAIGRAAVAASNPEDLTARALARYAEECTGAPITLLAVGKASVGMARAAAAFFGRSLQAGLVIAQTPADLPPPLEIMIGTHPLPTEASERAGRRALAAADGIRPDETLVVLLSGGASALMAVPAVGITLEDKCLATEQLLRAGTDITGLNTVRKHLSAIKGGRLALRTRGRIEAYAISDVAGDDPSSIASGPTVADPTTFGDALRVLSASGGLSEYPPAVAHMIRTGAAGQLVETPKPGDARLDRAHTRIIGSLTLALDAAATEAERRGYAVYRDAERITGESRVASRRFVEAATRGAAAFPRPCCVIGGGETTVRVVGHGRGGRNQEFALAAVPLLPGLGTAALGSLATDGIDGPTEAAGAIADASTLERAARLGIMTPDRFLADNNSHEFFAPLGDLIQTGPTGTNVGDVQILLLA